MVADAIKFPKHRLDLRESANPKRTRTSLVRAAMLESVDNLRDLGRGSTTNTSAPHLVPHTISQPIVRIQAVTDERSEATSRHATSHKTRSQASHFG